MDYFAVVSYGVFPTPTPTASARAAFAVSYGLLSSVPYAEADTGSVIGVVRRFMEMVLRWI